MCTAPTLVPVFHRLNRTEYQNSVNGLLGIALPLRDDLPADAMVNGFDNNADTAVSATLLQKYLTANQRAVEAALASPTAKAQLIPCVPETDTACARKVMTAFLPKAFRRPVLPSEIDEYLKYVTVCSSNATAGIGCAIEAALLSSKFLFRTELLNGAQSQAATCAEAVPFAAASSANLSAYALASRLSYLMWSSAPDQELLDLAAKGTLGDPAVLAAQVERMLTPTVAAKYARPFTESLATQWLQLEAVASAAPSKVLFPSFDEALRTAMQDEAKLFFSDVMLQNRSVLDLIRTNFTFVNARLATHYGLAGVTGTNMRKVDTAGAARGGILTQGSFLTGTSSSENTSIVLRAKWVLTNLLCTSLSAPPPGAADSVPPPDPGLGLTNRESLQFRTGNAPCNGCHNVLNPIGFGLEKFDAVGAARTLDKGKTIDSSGELPGGLKFNDTDELLALLKADERFPACFTKKLLTYALGRSMEVSCDDEAVKALAAEFKADGFQMKNHIMRIVKSDLFRTARRR
jgi:hypothetical protein